MRKVSLERFAGRTSEAGLKFSQITRPMPCFAASSRSFEWIEAENEVMMMAATSSRGILRFPSALLQVSWPSLQDKEQSGVSILTMW